MDDKIEAALAKLRAALEAHPRAVPILIEEAVAILAGDTPVVDRDLPSWHRGYGVGYDNGRGDRSRIARLQLRPEFKAYGVAYEQRLQFIFLDRSKAKTSALASGGELLRLIAFGGEEA